MKVFVVTNDIEERTRIRRLSFGIFRDMDCSAIRPEMLNSVIAHWNNSEPIVLVLVLNEDNQGNLERLSSRIRRFVRTNDTAYTLVLNAHDMQSPEWTNGFLVCHSFSQLRVRLREIAQIEERKAKRRKYKIITTSVSMLCALEGMLVVIYSFMVRDTAIEELYSGIIISAALAILVTWMLVYYARYQRISERREAKVYSNRIQRAISMDMGVNPDESARSNSQKVGVMERMTINLEDIKEYYVWSQKQAKYSFWIAITLCFVGIMLLVTAILLPTLFGQGITPAIISAAGGAVTELLAGTVLFVYRSSLSQLNHYHCALHEDERFLSSVSLVDKLSTVAKQDAMLEKIIDAELLLNFTEHQSISKDNTRE